MSDSPSSDLTLWQRYRREVVITLVALVVVAITVVLFPDVDLSRGSPTRWWIIGGLLVATLLYYGVRRLVRGRQEPADTP